MKFKNSNTFFLKMQVFSVESLCSWWWLLRVQQDSAPAHQARKSWDCAVFVFRFYLTTLMLSPSSPDLNSVD